MTATDLDRDLLRLDADLKQLEAEYNKFFAGRLTKPPSEARGRVETLVRRIDRTHIQNTGDRFRFETLQSRFAALVDLWDRGLRAREEGRPGPFSGVRTPASPDEGPQNDRLLFVATFRDPIHEEDKLTALYDSLAEARREVGADPVPFHRFADVVRTQVARLRHSGSEEVAFKVAVKNGKVSFTARLLKGQRAEG